MIIEKEINGKTYGFCFNFYAFAIAEEELKMQLDEILATLGPNNVLGKSRIKTICALFYAGAVNYRKKKSLTVDFASHDMGDWVDEIGYTESLEILTEALKVMRPKNIQPPQTEGEQNGKAGE